MLSNSPAPRRLAALATACLFSVAIPALPVLAKEKVGKTKPAAASAQAQPEYSVSIPSIVSVGSNVEDAVLTDILSGNLAEHADDLATLSATSISVPEITITVTDGKGGDDNSGTITFTDLVLADVANGVAGTVSLAGSDMVIDEASFTFGTMSAADFNLGGLLGIFGLVDASSQTGLATIYSDFSGEGGSFSAEDMDCSLGPFTVAEFKARPLQTNFVEVISLFEEMDEDSEDVDPAAIGKIMRLYADVLTAFESSEVTYGGISCDGVDDGEAVSFGIAGMTMEGMTPGRYPAVTMDGFHLTAGDEMAVTLESLTIKSMDLSNLLATLQSAPEKVDENWLEANSRNLLPDMEGFAFSGFSMDVPDPENDGEAVNAEVVAFDLTLGKYLNGVPTTASMSAENIRVKVPADTGDETWEQLQALGISEIDAGFRIAAAWDETSSAIEIEEASLTGIDLGAVKFAGLLTNATADLFATNPDTALEAAMGVALKSLDMSLVDAGLADIVLASIAADQGGDVETLRPIYADLAKGTAIALLAGMADAAKLGDALSAFISGTAKTLEIGILAKNEPGIDLQDFMAAEDNPSSLLEKVNITAVSK